MSVQVQEEGVRKIFPESVSKPETGPVRQAAWSPGQQLIVCLRVFLLFPSHPCPPLPRSPSPAFFSGLTRCHTWHSRWMPVCTSRCLANQPLLHWDGFFNTEPINKDPKCLRENDEPMSQVLTSTSTSFILKLGENPYGTKALMVFLSAKSWAFSSCDRQGCGPGLRGSASWLASAPCTPRPIRVTVVLSSSSSFPSCFSACTHFSSAFVTLPPHYPLLLSLPSLCSSDIVFFSPMNLLNLLLR